MLIATGRDHELAFPSQEIGRANEMLQFNHIILRASLITPLYALARRPYSRLACQMYYIWVDVILAERASAIIEPQERKSAHNFHSSLVRPVQRAAAARMLIAIYVDRSARGITADLGLDGQRARLL